MQYQIVRNSDAQGLVKEVSILIQEGWKPLGGVAVSIYWPESYSNKEYFYQAIIKEG